MTDPEWTTKDILFGWGAWIAFVVWLYLIVEVAFW